MKRKQDVNSYYNRYSVLTTHYISEEASEKNQCIQKCDGPCAPKSSLKLAAWAGEPPKPQRIFSRQSRGGAGFLTIHRTLRGRKTMPMHLRWPQTVRELRDIIVRVFLSWFWDLNTWTLLFYIFQGENSGLQDFKRLHETSCDFSDFT